MYKIGIIGDRDTVLGFMALGFSVHEASEPAEAVKKLQEMVRSEEYAVIFITEDLAFCMEEEIGRYKDLPLPAVISVPSRGGSTGYGMNNIRSAVQRAVGADILFKD